ncbi:MAG: ATPase, T2SS/T4P/T4SS family [Candidatus Anstonellales archaeon]
MPDKIKKEDEQDKAKQDKATILDNYYFNSESIPVNVQITRAASDFTPRYNLHIPGLGEGTKIVLNTLKAELVSSVKISVSEMLDSKKADEIKEKFNSKALALLTRNFPSLSDSTKQVLASYLIQNTLGLGELEALMHDDKLEEIAINNSNEPVWVYHKKWGWCKSNVYIRSEENIYDYAALIGRKIGKQINTLCPLMDAHLPTGERVNATLYPVSSFGNTITIRKFSQNPWTISRFVELECIPTHIASLIWLCVQNEMSLLVTGGTGSGKTSFLNAIATLIPANQRIISIEDTRELTLPSFMHWIPMVTKESNIEGKGEITMLDLLINSLRQRPDRILLGEVRTEREAQVMFEAMHTGHSVYATIHADNSQETVTRLTNPPINVPRVMLDSLSGIVVQYRNRRLNLRKTFEFAEVSSDGANVLYRLDIKSQRMLPIGKMNKLSEKLSLYSGLTQKEIDQDVEEKSKILSWMVRNKYTGLETVARIISNYYQSPDEILSLAEHNAKWEGI